ncbi:zinc finger and BTB domain-containing protein 41-like [Eupeodes corollae]|uniref:zinc finger and BTB domain-containing protein 41-like n=1 Tax=Eupeodes corollae TaxID=290404 RepID=UPI00249092D8|nr:zinc finger and BTB domain-containing protein 41-like [Eupeodes corollae]
MDKFETTCRTCNSIRTNLISLYSNSPSNDTIKLCDVLCLVCPSLSIQNNDKLPQKICFFCSKQLEIAYKFQLQCKKSNEDLWKVVKETIKEEPPQSEKEDDVQFSEDDEQTDTNNDDMPGTTEDVFEDATTVNGSPEFLEDDDVDEDMEILPQEEAIPVDKIVQSDADLDEASFDCSICSKKYLTVSGLSMHMKIAHKNHKPQQIETFPCINCDQVFESKDKEKDHFRSEHRNDYKSEVTCSICQKTFLGKSKLEHHLLYHEKNQFQCIVKECKRTFNIKYKVTDHLKRFHGIILTTSQSKALKPMPIKEL